MAHHKDAIKRNKQNIAQRLRNRHFRSLMRNRIRKLEVAIGEGNVETAQAELRTAVSYIQRIAGKGVIHRNQAARRVQRLNRAVHKMVPQPAE